MDNFLKQFLDSGKKVLLDTKAPRPTQTSKQKGKIADTSMEGDPHKVFVRRCISEKPKKAEVVKELKRFIEAEEALL